MEFEYTSSGIIIDGMIIDMDTIIENVNAKKVEESDLVILKIEWPSNRGFDGAYEKIVMSRSNAEEAKSLLTGIEVYFGEIAGKHSEIYGTIEENEISIIDDRNIVRGFLKNCPSGTSYNHSFTQRIYDYILDGEIEYLIKDNSEEVQNKFEKDFKKLFYGEE